MATVKRNVSQTAFMVEFLSNLLDPGHGHILPRNVAVEIFKPLLQDFISAFNLKPRRDMQASKAPNLDSNARHFGWPFSRHTPATKPLTAPVEADALAKLFNAILSLGLRAEASRLLDQIQKEAEVQDAKYFLMLFLPFLQAMAPVWSAQGIPYDNPICQSLYQSVLRSCVLRYVGKRPQPPTHWKRNPVRCGCVDCRSLNRFLTDPQQSVGRFSVATNRRAHLHGQLHGGDCTHETQRTGRPYTLVVTKTMRAYEKLATEWKNRCNEYNAETTGKFNRTVLQQLLGSELDELTSGVWLDASWQAAQPLMPSAGNSCRSAVPGPQSVPKQRAGTKRKAVEIIDLT